jgi:hypothetical protein
MRRGVGVSRRFRLSVEVLLAAASGLVGLVTLVWPDWIELVFGADPDGGNGAVEVLIVIAFLCVSVGTSLVARWEFRVRPVAKEGQV